MTPLTKIAPVTESDPELESLKDSAATQRALDYYLKPAVSQPPPEKKVFLVNSDLTQEEALLHASDYLRCAIANAQGEPNISSAPRVIYCSICCFSSSRPSN